MDVVETKPERQEKARPKTVGVPKVPVICRVAKPTTPPPTYVDINKSCKDLFTKGYSSVNSPSFSHCNHRPSTRPDPLFVDFGFVKLETKAPVRNRDLEFKSTASHNVSTGKLYGTLEAKYNIASQGRLGLFSPVASLALP